MSRGTTRSGLLNAIRALADGGNPPTVKEMNQHGEFSGVTYYNHFDSWNDALRQAGFKPNHEMGVSVSKVCEVCGDKFDVTPFHSEQRFCSRDCFAEDRKGRFTGKDHPRHTDRVEVECSYCGSTLERLPHRVRGQDSHFCDISCKGKARKGTWEGEDNPRWREPASLVCDHCEKQFNRPHYAISESQSKTFCTRECHRAWFSENAVGESNPNWKGGGVKYDKYGPRWSSIRKAVIESQNETCRVCTTHRRDLTQDLHVHHVTPIREFRDPSTGEIDHESANRFENLVALCKRCHDKWEGLPVVPTATSA